MATIRLRFLPPTKTVTDFDSHQAATLVAAETVHHDVTLKIATLRGMAEWLANQGFRYQTGSNGVWAR